MHSRLKIFGRHTDRLWLDDWANEQSNFHFKRRKNGTEVAFFTNEDKLGIWLNVNRQFLISMRKYIQVNKQWPSWHDGEATGRGASCDHIFMVSCS